MRNGNFRPPTESTPSTDRQKIFHRWLRRDPYSYDKFGAHPSTGGFWANVWNIKYNQFLFMTFLRELTYRSDPSTDFQASWLKRRGFCWYISPFRESNPLPQKINFGGVNTHFRLRIKTRKNHKKAISATLRLRFSSVVSERRRWRLRCW